MSNKTRAAMVKAAPNRRFTFCILTLSGGIAFKLGSMKDMFYVPMQEFMGLTNTRIGGAMSAYGIVQTIGLIVGIYICDMFSKKYMIGIGLVGFYLATFPPYWGFLAAFGGMVQALRSVDIWAVALNGFVVYCIYCGLTCFIPFLNNIYLLPATAVGAYGIINQYGLKMVGGFMSNKVHKSSAKHIRMGFIVCIVAMALFLMIPHEAAVGNSLVHWNRMLRAGKRINGFATVWEPLRYVVSVCLLLFSTTTLMSQWYFGFVGLNYVFGSKVADKFKYVFPAFCIIGALLKVEMVWTIQDIALALLTIPNLIAMVVLFPKVRKATREFFSDPELCEGARR